MLSLQRAHDALARRPALADALLAVVVGAVSVMAAFGGEPTSATALEPLDAVGVVLLLAASAALAWHRRAPLAVFAANLLLLGAYLAQGYTEDYTGYSMFAALLSLSIQRPLRTAASAGAVCVALIFVLREPHFGFVLLNVVQISALVFAVVLGAYLRTRREYLRASRERGRLARSEAEHAHESALVRERGRIARELHDVVAHSMSVVALQVGGARLLMLRDAARADEALGRAEEATREALSELRRLLGVLHPEEAAEGLPPQPSLATLAELIDGSRAAGLRIEHHVEGGERPLRPALELSVFRIVQESLTNVLRHVGPGADVLVVLRYGRDALEVEVSNTASGLRPPSAAAGEPGSGRGLIGMRERAEIFGGHLTAGPRPDGGFRVLAHFPLGPPGPEPPVVEIK